MAKAILVTPPASVASDLLAAAKLAARVTATSEDQRFRDNLDLAQGQVGAYLNRAIGVSTWKVAYDRFSDAMELPKGPVLGITSITYIDSDGAAQTLDSASYMLTLFDDPQFVLRLAEHDWPETLARAEAVVITFTAGWVPGADSPEGRAVRSAIVTCANLWHHDPAQTGMLAPAAEATLYPYRRLAL